METAKTKPKEEEESRSKLVVELMELDEIYQRFEFVFILSNILTMLLVGYVITLLRRTVPALFGQTRWYRLPLQIDSVDLDLERRNAVLDRAPLRRRHPLRRGVVPDIPRAADPRARG